MLEYWMPFSCYWRLSSYIVGRGLVYSRHADGWFRRWPGSVSHTRMKEAQWIQLNVIDGLGFVSQQE